MDARRCAKYKPRLRFPRSISPGLRNSKLFPSDARNVHQIINLRSKHFAFSYLELIDLIAIQDQFRR
jgi:hypothetical protein